MSRSEGSNRCQECMLKDSNENCEQSVKFSNGSIIKGKTLKRNLIIIIYLKAMEPCVEERNHDRVNSEGGLRFSSHHLCGVSGIS